MSKRVRLSLPVSVLTVTLAIAGCHKDNTTAQDSTDPAAVNQASPDQTVDTSAQQPAQSYAPQQSQASAGSYAPTRHRSSASSAGEAMPPEPPADNGYSASNSQAQPPTQYANQYADAGNYGEGSYNEAQYSPEYQPVYATQPPPEIPVYEQPPCPGDNYIWTPGNWNYANGGYYWVPGAWVQAPYDGALWTPGYWGYGGDRYAYHHGYWGRHIGFYGGVALGFGYFGHGYEGGYWNNNHFYYNRAVTHVNENVRNVYVHNVTVNNVTINNYTTNNYTNNNISRVSYNGGRGGVEARPLPYEVAAAREQHIAPLPQQMQHAREASMNRAQFAGPNGKPQMLVAARPIQVQTRPTPVGLPTLSGRPAVSQEQFHPAPARPMPNAMAQNGARPGSEQQGHPGVQPSNINRAPDNHAQLNQQHPQPQARPGVELQHPASVNQSHLEQQQHPQTPQQQARPAYNQQRPEVQQNHAPLQPQQNHAEPQRPQQQARPTNQPVTRPEPVQRTGPAQRPERPEQAHPEPAPRPQAVQPQPVRPQVQSQPHVQAQPEHNAPTRPQPEQHQQPRPESQPHPAPGNHNENPHG